MYFAYINYDLTTLYVELFFGQCDTIGSYLEIEINPSRYEEVTREKSKVIVGFGGRGVANTIQYNGGTNTI